MVQYMNGLTFDIAYTRMYSPSMDTVGDRLDKAMTDAKITSQMDLSRLSEVPQATISRILKGAGKKGPEAETVKKLANALGVSFDWLNEGIGSQTKTKGVVTPVANKAVPDDRATPEEFVQLVRDFAACSATDRKLFLKSMAAAAKRTIGKRPSRTSAN
jgi:transcriptional regulator with XRE-family HTH domain